MTWVIYEFGRRIFRFRFRGHFLLIGQSGISEVKGPGPPGVRASERVGTRPKFWKRGCLQGSPLPLEEGFRAWLWRGSSISFSTLAPGGNAFHLRASSSSSARCSVRIILSAVLPSALLLSRIHRYSTSCSFNGAESVL